MIWRICVKYRVDTIIQLIIPDSAAGMQSSSLKQVRSQTFNCQLSSATVAQLDVLKEGMRLGEIHHKVTSDGFLACKIPKFPDTLTKQILL